MSLDIRLFVDDKEILSGSASDAYPGRIEEKAAEFVKFVMSGRLDTIDDGRARRVVLEWTLDGETVKLRRQCGQDL